MPRVQAEKDGVQVHPVQQPVDFVAGFDPAAPPRQNTQVHIMIIQAALAGLVQQGGHHLEILRQRLDDVPRPGLHHQVMGIQGLQKSGPRDDPPQDLLPVVRLSELPFPGQGGEFQTPVLEVFFCQFGFVRV